MAEKQAMPKLILISPMLHQGGFERVCVTTARLLQPFFDVSIVIFDDSDIAFDISGLNIINLNLGAKPGKINKLITLMKRIVKLKKIKRELKPVASYSFGATANLSNSLSKVKGVPTWCGIRSYMDMLRKKEVRFIIDRSDMVVCCAKAIEEELNNEYDFHKTFTLYNPYDKNSIKEASREDISLPWDPSAMINIISMGREDIVKGYWHLIKVFSEVNKQYDNARLIFIGDGDFSAYMKLCEELKIREKVHFAGLQKNPYKYLKIGDIYALTSENEGFPNALVEGMMFGMAAIATDCKTGPSEILENGKNGILMPVFSGEPDFDANNVTEEEKAFAMKICELIANEEELKKYQRLSEERASDFTAEAYTKKLCEELMNQRK